MNNSAKQYDTVWSADDPDQEEFLSETDVEEGHEKQWHSDENSARRRGKTQRPWATLRAHKGLIDTSLLLVILALLSLLLLRRPQQPGGRQIGGDYTGAGPECQSPPSKRTRCVACMHARTLTLTRPRLTQLNEYSPCENRKVERRRVVRAAQRNGMVLGRAAGEVEHHDARRCRPTLGRGGLLDDFDDTFAALPGEARSPAPLPPKILRRPRIKLTAPHVTGH